jgi:hypothetical protein
LLVWHMLCLQLSVSLWMRNLQQHKPFSCSLSDFKKSVVCTVK